MQQIFMQNHINIMDQKRNPRDQAGILSKIFFIYTLPIFKRGLSRGINSKDLYSVVPNFESKILGDELENQKFDRDESVLKFLWRCFGWTYLLINLTQIINIVISTSTPRIISKIVSFYISEQNSINRKTLMIYGSVLIIITYIRTIYVNNFAFWSQTFALKIRTALISYIYRQVLKANSSEIDEKLLGTITTVVSNDLHEIERFLYYFPGLCTDIVKVLVTFIVLYQGIGNLLWISLIVYFILIFFLAYTGYQCSQIIRKQNTKAEERLQLSKEMLSENKTIKMYTWEKYFVKKINIIRKNEMCNYMKLFTLHTLNLTSVSLCYRLCIILTLVIGSWYNYGLRADTVYFTISCFNIMSAALQISFLLIVYLSANFSAGVKRLTHLLHLLERFTSAKSKIQKEILTSKSQIVLKDLDLQFGNKIIFAEATVKITTSVTVIQGVTGSGKTAFLKTISSFYKASSGSLRVDGVLSYASQEPWLFPASIRENIIFAENFDEKRYRKVLEICALDYDFLSFENGDLTLVANHGINLSKGQRARINFARAVYKKADIYLLDDCLSSLDMLVSNFIFKKCLVDFLKNKIVVFVTHRSYYTKFVDSIVEISNGKVYQRNVSDKSEIIVEDFVKAVDTEELDEEVDEETRLINKHQEEKTLYEEHKNSGQVKWMIYYKTIRHGRCLFLIFSIILCYIWVQFCIIYTDRSINTWINLENRASNYTKSNLTTSEDYKDLVSKKKEFILTYSAFLAMLVLFIFARGFSVYNFFNRISINLHRSLIANLMNAEMRFFDKTFLGNILNRLSMDFYTLDKLMPQAVFAMIKLLLELSGILIVISIVSTQFLIPNAVLCLLLIILRIIYLKSSRELKRLKLITRSSMIGLLTATLNGLPTIKILKAENKFKNDFDNFQNSYTSSSYMFISCAQAYTFLSEFCTSTLICIVISKFSLWINDTRAENVGLAITQAFVITGITFFFLSNWAEIENLMTSVERLMEYVDVKTENKQGINFDNFPKNGRIIYQNVSLKYAESGEYVLKNLNLAIDGQEKIGIVGRTGSGKSSIISALFRLYDIEGKIFIDGIDHKTLSLDCLRSRISMIPQDTFLFKGTIRENIDPLEAYSDEDIWKVLDSTGLKPLFSSLDQKISSESSLSCGQRQLISLARVLISNNKIIVFDEASESMDQEMSTLLKKILKEKNRSCTTISIAHKLDFVLDCDKILVLDQGRIVEFDSVANLLNNKETLFYKMAREDELL